jgi:hypothetical protein
MPVDRVIGIDFDNTIASYDLAMKEMAVERRLVDPVIVAQKKFIRDAIRQREGGEIQWQELQADVYGPYIERAEMIDGVASFFRTCRQLEHPVYIVSHKTEFATRGDGRTNLRTLAMEWMKNRGFFDSSDIGLSPEHVYFENTLEEKVKRIRSLGCTDFVDDLEETFQHASFPDTVARYLYSPHGEVSAISGVNVACDWKQISEEIFPQIRSENLR